MGKIKIKKGNINIQRLFRRQNDKWWTIFLFAM